MRKQLCWLFNVTLLFSEVPSASSSHRPTKREFHYQLKWEKGKRKTKPINNVGQEREDKILPSQQDIIIDNGVHSCYLNGSLKAVIQATVDNRDISLLSHLCASCILRLTVVNNQRYAAYNCPIATERREYRRERGVGGSSQSLSHGELIS